MYAVSSRDRYLLDLHRGETWSSKVYRLPKWFQQVCELCAF